MVHVIADRVRDTSTTTGTGNFTVANSPPNGYETLDTVLATSDLFDYLIQHQTANEWETGIGTYNGSHVFVRTTVKQSSNADAAVNFSAGTKDIVLVLSADRIKNPRVPDGSSISDDAGNELIVFAKIASAVNETTVRNAATGNAPALVASGGDTDIGINLVPKGAGTLQRNSKTVLDQGRGATLDSGFGIAATSVDDGTKSSGTFTPTFAAGNIRRYINGGAHTLAPPSGEGCMIIQITNNGSAGAVTTSGFTLKEGVFDTTNGSDFLCQITVINGFSHLSIKKVS